MAKAKQLSKGGNWRVLVYAGKDGEKRIYKSFTADTPREAEFLAAEYAFKHKQGNKAENLTFQVASDRYIENKSNLLSPSTIRGYRIVQRNAFNLLLSKTLGDLSSSDIIQKQMNENAKKYSAKSMSNQFGFISAVMKYHKIDIDRATLKPKDNKSLPVPTQQDVEKIMSILASEPRIECHILLALTCSLRQSEMAAIKVSDIEENKIYIHASKVPNEHSKLVYKPTNKSEAGTRTIVMPDFLTQKIKERCGEITNEYLFTYSPGWILKLFKRLLSENGIPKYTVHSLRHSFAAIMHAQGVPDKYVMEMGGWATDNVLKNVYQYTFEEEVNKAKEKANSYFENIIQHEMQHDKK